MKIKKIFFLVFIFSFLKFSFTFGLNELPFSLQESVNFFFKFLKEFPGYFLRSLNEILEILKKSWDWFNIHFFKKIYFSIKKEIKKRELIIKKEFEKEKLETKKEFKEGLKSLLNKALNELKKK